MGGLHRGTTDQRTASTEISIGCLSANALQQGKLAFPLDHSSGLRLGKFRRFVCGLLRHLFLRCTPNSGEPAAGSKRTGRVGEFLPRKKLRYRSSGLSFSTLRTSTKKRTNTPFAKPTACFAPAFLPHRQRPNPKNRPLSRVVSEKMPIAFLPASSRAAVFTRYPPSDRCFAQRMRSRFGESHQRHQPLPVAPPTRNDSSLFASFLGSRPGRKRLPNQIVRSRWRRLLSGIQAFRRKNTRNGSSSALTRSATPGEMGLSEKGEGEESKKGLDLAAQTPQSYEN